MFRAAVFVLCAAVRLLCTYLSQIPDCDEVFNYWEPLHYVLFGSGLQTWEYAPTFALRSYAYLVSGFFYRRLFSIHLFYHAPSVPPFFLVPPPLPTP